MSEQQELFCYKQMPVWTEDEIPEALLSKHNTAAGTWGCLNVLQGRLNFNEVDEAGNITATHELTPESGDWIIHPQAWHFIAPQTQDTEIQLSFYCEAADYFNKKYGMSATHSAVRAAEGIVPVGKVLDMGCGQGRNALYLGLKGFDVTAVDNNPHAVQNVEELARIEELNVRAFEYDLNAANIQENFDYMVATVVFMFLMPRYVPDVIANMKEHTNPGGYNLIVSAMDTEDFPCPMPFPFKFGEGELREYYKDWELVEYKEELGSMHAKDEFGNPIQFKFVTMLAKKPQ
ncbi:SAM-dependent methyltransferase TehB [Neisseria sp. DTU_2021_1001991_1_SI_NGA_ILE_055]|uniref:SAM-dependent methyltransferase TehB n=1 Tax=Neisseria sp. DTU_2021_1001991_1_SI_NGA_ILE_055 TaxID=3077590 RepID=UPI0028EA4764|nr:SAM-dependent methyltransferase TehB [Neisseria sp. DTU_2021_1001991_1_SI_NGA_ILE_055]WNS82586.1 SAM-dependent methyltransferase TehB [Neisseria sp. DTU_2021_1001991_1_SI_NGA_ILE_055]